MALSQIGPAGVAGGLGDIMGLIGGISQQNQMNSAISGIGGNLNNILQSLGGDAGKLISNYMGVTLPQLQQMVSTLSPEQQQAFGQAMQGFTAAQGNAQALQNNPYLAQIGQMGNQFMSPGSTPSMAQMGQVAKQLQNWQGLKPQELSALQMQAGDAARSAANTMQQQMGGVANPALLMKQLAGQAGQTGQGAAVQLGNLAAQQELGAKESAGGLYGQMTSDQIQKMQDALSAYTQQSGQYLQGQEGAGQLNLGAGQGFSGLSGQSLNAMLDSLGLQQSGMQSGMQSLGGLGNTYENMLNNFMGYQQQQGNPYQSFFQNIAGIIPSGFGGQYTGGFPGSDQYTGYKL